MDISVFFNWFMNEIVKLFKSFFNILDSITFNGVSLLQFSLWCLILSALIPIIFSIARTQSGRMSYSGRTKGQKSSGGEKS